MLESVPLQRILKQTHIMNIQLIVWGCIAAVSMLIICARIYSDFISGHKHNNVLGHHRFIEIGSEREEFFIPGDPSASSDCDENDD